MSSPENQEPPRFEPPPEPDAESRDERLKRYGLIGLAALALGLGASTGILAARGPEEVTTTELEVSTKKLRPTTTTVVTEVVTTTTETTTETTDTVTETETVTEAVPPGQDKRKPPKPPKDKAG